MKLEMPGSPKKRTEPQRTRPRIRARRENGQVAPFLSRDPTAIGEALKRLAAGDSVRAIADDLGVTHQAIRVLLLDEVPDEYRVFQRRSLIARIVEADQQLEEAATPIAIVRARELCRFARWDAERRLPHMFGQQTRIEVGVAPDLADALRRARERERVIESEPAQPALPATRPE